MKNYHSIALLSGAGAAGVTFGVCSLIPFVGSIVGLVAAPVAFAAVEIPAWIGIGSYEAARAIKHACQDHHKGLKASFVETPQNNHKHHHWHKKEAASAHSKSCSFFQKKTTSHTNKEEIKPAANFVLK